MSVINFISSNLFTIIFIVFVIYIIRIVLRKRKKSTSAGGTGPVVTGQPLTEIATTETGTGDKIFDGNTGGIDWKLTSTIRKTGYGSRGAPDVWKRKTVWKTTGVVWPEGRYLMIVSTPGELKTGEIKRTGILNKIINIAADAMIDIYVAGYFGDEYKSLVGIGENGEVIKKDVLKDFFIITNDPTLSGQYLDDATVNAISSWKQKQLGFGQEQQVDQFGVLFAPDATIVACQAALRKPEEVKIFSDFASAMAVKMKNQLANLP